MNSATLRSGFFVTISTTPKQVAHWEREVAK